MKFSDITPTFGVELSDGIQLTEFTDADVSALKQIAAERGVVVARNEVMDGVAQAAFGSRLGQIMDSPVKLPDVPEGLMRIQAGPKTKPKTVAGNGWHSDVSSEAITPGLSMLCMEIVPPSGTAWLSGYGDWRGALSGGRSVSLSRNVPIDSIKP